MCTCSLSLAVLIPCIGVGIAVALGVLKVMGAGLVCYLAARVLKQEDNSRGAEDKQAVLTVDP